MNAIFSETASEDFQALEPPLQQFFKKHIEKLREMPPRRHLRFGLPYHVEDITKQARLIYFIRGETLYIIRCFATHKDYEKWYKSFA